MPPRSDEYSQNREPLDPPLRTRFKRMAVGLGITGVGALVGSKTGHSEGIVDNLVWTAGYLTTLGGTAVTIISLVPETLNLAEHRQPPRQEEL